MRQQRVQQQEAETPHHLHQRAAGRAGEGLPENTLSRCLCEGTAGHEDGAHRGQSAGTVDQQAVVVVAFTYGEKKPLKKERRDLRRWMWSVK